MIPEGVGELRGPMSVVATPVVAFPASVQTAIKRAGLRPVVAVFQASMVA